MSFTNHFPRSEDMLKNLFFVAVVVLFFSPVLVSAGEFDRWVTESVNSAIAEADRLKTRQDTEWWARARVVPIYNEFFLSKSVGKIDVGPYNTPMRDYSGENLEKIAQDVERFMAALGNIRELMGPIDYERQRIQLLHILTRVRDKNTPASRYQEEMIKQYLQPHNK